MLIQGVDVQMPVTNDPEEQHRTTLGSVEVQLHHNPDEYWERRRSSATSAALECFPSSRGIGAWAQIECALILPSPVDDPIVARMNEAARTIHTDLLAYVKEGGLSRLRPEHREFYLGSALLPTEPTLLPFDYGKDPVASLRKAVRHLQKLIVPDPPRGPLAVNPDKDKPKEEEKCDLELFYFPGYARCGYGHDIKDYVLRSFSILPVSEEAGGIVTCQAWSLTKDALSRISNAVQTTPTEDMVSIYAQQLLSMAARFGSQAVFAHLSSFAGDGDKETDYLKAWISLITTMHTSRVPQLAFAAVAHDTYPPPVISGARMPKYIPLAEISQAEPFMPHVSRQPRRGGPRPGGPATTDAPNNAEAEWRAHANQEEDLEAGEAGW